MKNIVISDLTIEETNSYRCRKCNFQSKHFARVKKHISNRHYVGPAVECKLCGFQSKNVNALRQHVFRNQNNAKTKISEGTRNASSTLVEPPECPPPPPPTPSSGQTGLVMERQMTHRNPTENDTSTSERRIDTTLSLRDVLCGRLNSNRAMGH